MRLPTMFPDMVAAIDRRTPHPEDFTSPARGPRTTARLGIWVGVLFGICFLTGIWSHYQYTSPGWLPIGPNPSWLYRVTQGLHVASGTAVIPLLLVKLWSVFPRLFIRPPTAPKALVREGLERASIAVLMAAGLFQLVSGTLNVVQWYPWEFSFRPTHEAVAWIVIGGILVHIAVKLPVIRDAYSGGSADDDESRGSDGPSRRAVLVGAGSASALAVLLTAGQTVPFLRRVSVFGVRDGEGPQDLPVNRTARAAGAIDGATDPDFALELRHGSRTVRLSRAQVAALPQRTHRLPITCVEGWSRNATWTGVAVRDLLALVDAAPASVVKVSSMQTRGAFSRSELPADFASDPRTLLALELNGEPLSLDHGYPCRIIAPNRPGVFQTKWVSSLEVGA
ncbi:MAG: molybdopterin-dependent oxidoreductase [Aeromicrobium sp.]